MPVHKIQGGYQYGATGKKYYGKDAKKKAERQALAIRLSGYDESKGPNGNKTSMPKRNETRTDYKVLGKAFVERFLRKDA